MISTQRKLALALSLFAAGSAEPLIAGFDQWQINEIFSSADGSIQYIELKTSVNDQQDLNGLTLVVTGIASQIQTSTQLSGNLVGATANKHVLIATQSFATLTGLTPDYLINAGFLSTNGGTVNFAGGVASFSYEAAQLPVNGVQSLDGSGAAVDASPTTFNGLLATVEAPVYANFDVTSSILNLPLLDVPGIGLANISFDVNLPLLQFALRNDFFLYDSGIIAGNNAAQLLADNVLFIPALPIGTDLYAFKLGVVGDNPLTFGNIFDVVVTNTVPVPEPEPEPEPQPSELQQSIARGQTQYELRCSVCHGDSGGGGAGPDLRASSLNTFTPLRSYIDLNMPQGNASSCRDNSASTCATDAANYIINVFQ